VTEKKQEQFNSAVEVPENKSIFSNPSGPNYFPRHSGHNNDRSIFLKTATLTGTYLFLESKSVCKFLKAKS